MEQNKPIFTDGLIIKRPEGRASEFIEMKLSFKRIDFLNWLDSQKGEWINVDVKTSKQGKLYGCLNQWKKQENS